MRPLEWALIQSDWCLYRKRKSGHTDRHRMRWGEGLGMLLSYDVIKNILNWTLVIIAQGIPGGSVVKNPPANTGDVGSIPGLGRCSGEESGNPLQYSCLGNPMNRRA